MNRPNVILMFVDDLGYGDISAFNPQSRIRTDNIDRLAQQGMRFTDSHASSSLCTPSRYGLLTGRYNWRSSLKFAVLYGTDEPLVEKGRMTLGSLFKNNGYKTACVGKWHLGMEWAQNPDPKPDDFDIDPEEYEHSVNATGPRHLNPSIEGLKIDYTKPLPYSPNKYGFDYFFGLPSSLDQPPFVYIENDRILTPPTSISGIYNLNRMGPGQEQLWERGLIAPGFDHTQVVPDMQQKVIDLIDEYSEGEEPFFIYYPTPAVHGPLLPLEQFVGKSGIGVYGDMVLQVDAMVGEIMAKLDEKGIADNTVFIFTSDNGCSAIADYRALQEKGHYPSYIFRGEKTDIYEGGHRVPTIIRYPDAVQGGTVCEQTVCHVDFFRTFAEMLKYEVPDDAAEDSVSNLPLWNGENEAVRESVIYSSGMGYFAIQEKNWKLELCTATGGLGPAAMLEKPGVFQLYDMAADVREQKNVIDEHPELVARLKKKLTEFVFSGRSTPGAPQKNTGPEIWPQINWLEESAK